MLKSFKKPTDIYRKLLPPSKGAEFLAKFHKPALYAHNKGPKARLILLSVDDNQQLNDLGSRNLAIICDSISQLRFVTTRMESKSSLLVCEPVKIGSMRVFSVEQEHEYPPITKDDSSYYKLMLSYMEL